MTEYFNLSGMKDSLEASIFEDDDVTIQGYLDSYKELNTFFNLMGTIFSFVSSDLKAKMDILQAYLDDNNVSNHFKTVKTMIRYEKDNNLLTKSDYTSGSRTLLRLHRGLDFIRTFLKQLGELQDADNTSSCCRASYDATLAQHHTFFIRQGAKLAMYTMPTREQLFIKVCCGDKCIIDNSLRILPSTLATTEIVYNRIEALYTKYDLHSLP